MSDLFLQASESGTWVVLIPPKWCELCWKKPRFAGKPDLEIGVT